MVSIIKTDYGHAVAVDGKEFCKRAHTYAADTDKVYIVNILKTFQTHKTLYAPSSLFITRAIKNSAFCAIFYLIYYPNCVS